MEMPFLSSLATEKWGFAFVIAGFVALGLGLQLLHTNTLSDIPFVGEELGSDEKRRAAYMSNGHDMYINGLQKKQGFPYNNHTKYFSMILLIIATAMKLIQYMIGTESPVLVFPPRYFKELRALPDDVLSFVEAADEAAQAKYTQIHDHDGMIAHILKSKLTPSLARISPMISNEVQNALQIELPPCDDWTSVKVYPKMLRIITIVSGRILVGPELGQSEEWIDAATGFASEVLAAIQAIWTVSPWKRWFVCPFLSEVRTLEARVKKFVRFLTPVVEQRLHLLDDDVERPDDMLQWFVDLAKSKGAEVDVDKIARRQLATSFAAIQPTTSASTNALYTLATMPEFVAELRDEIRDVLATHGRHYSSKALYSMKKLDSFLKESLRFHPENIAVFGRKVIRTFTLSDGLVVPAGVLVEIPAHAVSMDPVTFPEPQKFDPLRFYRLREEQHHTDEDQHVGDDHNNAQNQLVSVTNTNLVFGYGRHACPGRFFAANELKMIIINIIMNYDIRLEEGVTERYSNNVVGLRSLPSVNDTLQFKRVRV